ncbi:hypothetical protein M0R72_05085 [Candidatus Pacearchaeota archaeon]|jgi:Na+-transporting methylmalonyl-CoA/oxaloacetate decarboxylase gamma subunit|nr:hypothetical protein [Candidatus Pacearchaeota archaeon]
MSKIFFNKRGVAGEVVTWTSATLAIIGVLILFLFLSSLLAVKIKILNLDDVKSDVDEDSPVLAIKTALAHQIRIDENRELIDTILEEKNEE